MSMAITIMNDDGDIDAGSDIISDDGTGTGVYC